MLSIAVHPMLIGLWASVFTMLILWTILHLYRSYSTYFEVKGLEVEEGSEGPVGEESLPAGATSSETIRSPSLPLSGRADVSSLSTAMVLNADMVEDPDSLFSVWLSQIDRAVQAGRIGFLYLLLAVTITSLPQEYKCPKTASTVYYSILGRSPWDATNRTPPPLIPPTECGLCVGNLTNNATSVLIWVFFALVCIWIVSEFMVKDGSSSAAIRFFITLLAQPLVAATLIIAYINSKSLETRNC